MRNTAGAAIAALEASGELQGTWTTKNTSWVPDAFFKTIWLLVNHDARIAVAYDTAGDGAVVDEFDYDDACKLYGLARAA